MALTTVNITGTFNFPDATWSQYTKAEFHLSGYDTDTDVVVPKVTTVALGALGELNVNLWGNDDGLRGTVYRVNVVVYEDSGYSREVLRRDLGRIQVAGDGPIDIATLLDSPVGVPGVWYSTISQVEYDAVIAAAAQVAFDADRTEVNALSVVDRAWFKDVADLTGDNNVIIGYTGSGAQFIVVAGDVIEAEGFRYEVAASGAVDQNISTLGGVKLYVISDEYAVNLIAYGAAGDGITNDKTIIDTYNTAGMQVNLGGRDYAYTGDFVPLARFINGQIVSSTLGTFDYRTQIYSQAKTVTVGVGQTLTTLAAAKNWLKDIQWADLTLTVSGNHDLSDIRWDHIDTPRLKIIGTALSGAMPQAVDMVGVRATDEATILSRFTASIDVGGVGDSSVGGVNFPNGLAQLENVAVTGNTRYMFSTGFNDGHANSTHGNILRVANCSFIGGVWGILAVGCEVRIRAGTRVFFAYQNTGTQPGGPMDIINSHARFEGFYEAYSAGQSSKYGLYCEAGSTVKADQRIVITGPFLHGILAKDVSNVDCDLIVCNGVSQPITALSGSTVDGISYVFSNGDVANTNTLSGAGQNGWGNNNSSGAIVFAGYGSSVSLNAGTIDNMIASYAFHAIGGNIYQGTTAVAVDDCKFSLAFARFYTSGTNYLAFNITNPKVGSLDQCLALAISTIRVGTNSGASFGPAINTTANGNLFATTG